MLSTIRILSFLISVAVFHNQSSALLTIVSGFHDKPATQGFLSYSLQLNQSSYSVQKKVCFTKS